MYSLQWLHNGTPPDFQLQLVRDPAIWFDTVSLALFAELAKHRQDQPPPPPADAALWA